MMDYFKNKQTNKPDQTVLMGHRMYDYLHQHNLLWVRIQKWLETITSRKEGFHIMK